MNSLFINDVFDFQGSRYRLLAISTSWQQHEKRGGDKAYVISLSEENPQPIGWPIEFINSQDFMKKRVLVTALDEGYRNVPSSKDIQIREQRWDRIKDIVKNPELFEKATRNAFLKHHASNIGVTHKSLAADLRRYWLGGQTTNALLGNFYRCGQIEPTTALAHVIEKRGTRGKSLAIFAPTGKVARGRKPKNGEHQAFVISKMHRTEILHTASKHYLEDESKSVRGATIAVLKVLYSYRDSDNNIIIDEAGRPLIRPPGQRPSIEQVRRILGKALSLSSKTKARTSAAEFNNNHAASTGSVKDDCIGPGDVYEIDATFVDLFIVATADRKTIIGKLTLYLIIDRYSRLIVGLHISLENPSWAEAKLAILSIGGDWEVMCKRANIPYDPADWPARGVMPNRFVGDRGEMISRGSDILCDALRISITNPPSRGSSRKPIVESSFKSTHVAIKDNIPGHEPPKNPYSRSGKHYDKKACLNLDEAFSAYMSIVRKHNRTIKVGYQLSPEEVFKGFSPIPVNIWNRGVENQMGSLSRYDYKFLQRALSPSGQATVKVDGIHFKGCIYECPEAYENDWMPKASLYGSYSVNILFSTGLVDEIIVDDPNDSRKTYVCKLTSKTNHFTGYSFAEVAAFTTKLRALHARGRTDELEASVALSIEIDRIVVPAKSQMKADTKGVLLGSRLSAGPDARALEARARKRNVHNFSSKEDGAIRTTTSRDEGAESGQVTNVVDIRATEVFPPFDNAAVHLKSVNHAEEVISSQAFNGSDSLLDQLSNMMEDI